MELLGSDGSAVSVPERLAAVVRWLVTEAAPAVADRTRAAKIVINLGRGEAPTTTVLERYETLDS